MPKKPINNKKISQPGKNETIASQVQKINLVHFIKENTFFSRFLIVLLILIIASYAGLLRLGPIRISDERYISVIGTFTGTEQNKVATINATITETNVSKDAVIQSVSKKSNNLIELIKNTGIDPTDVKTTSNAVYKVELQPANPAARTAANEQWRNTVSIDIKVRDLNKLGDIYSSITSLENVELFGPSFALDNKSIDESRMLVSALEDAKEKAKFVAKNNNKRLGKIISIEEISNTNIRPFNDILGLGGGGKSAELIPGSSEVSKSVYVKFILY